MYLTEIAGNAEKKSEIYSKRFNESRWPLRALRDIYFFGCGSAALRSLCLNSDNTPDPKRRIVMKKRSFIFTISVPLMFCLLAGAALAAEKYPNRPINMIVGFAPGGASDLGSKIIADRMTEFLGQPLTPVYKPG